MAATALALGAGGTATDATPAKGESQKTEKTKPAKKAGGPLYTLPSVGKPRRRVGGGRRGPAEALPEVFVLVPSHVGQTVSTAPVLYWYLDETNGRNLDFELTMIDEESIDPLVDAQLELPTAPGLQRIDLAKHGVKLEIGQEYQWSVALVGEGAERSADVVSAGWIERVPEPDGLAARVAAAGPDGAHAVYGAAGLWYDLLDAIAKRADSDPAARADLARLLEEVGLPALPAAGIASN